MSGDSELALAGTCEPGTEVALAPDGATTVCAPDGTFILSLARSTDGAYDVSLTQRDAAGNTSAVTGFTWERDTTLPDAVTLLSPALSPVWNRDDSLAIEVGCSDGDLVYMQGASTQLGTCVDGTLTFDVAAAIDGSYTFTLFQEYPPTHALSAVTSLTWVRDTTAPDQVVVTAPAASPHVSGDDGVTLIGTCERGATVTLAGAATDATTCVDGAFTFHVARTSNATYNFQLGQTDRAGNAAIPIPFQWVRDDTVPSSPNVSSPASAAVTTSGDTLTIAGACTDGLTVKLAGASTQEVVCAGGFTFGVGAASDGAREYRLTQVNVPTGATSGAVTVTWVRDTVAPAAPGITSPTSTPYASGDTLFTLAGTCESGATVTLSGAQSASVGCVAGVFQVDLAKSQNGTWDYALTQTDRAGLTSPVRPFTWIRDASIPPTVVLSSPLVNPSVSAASTLTIAGSCAGSNVVRVRGAASADATCAAGAFSVVVGAAIDGTYAYEVTQVSAVNGSSSAPVALSWTRDTAAPSAPTLIALSPRSPSANAFPKLTGGAPGDAAAIQVYKSVDCTGPITASGAPALFTGGGLPIAATAQATMTVSARAVDAAGNPSLCSATSLSYRHRSAEMVRDINTVGNGDSTPTQFAAVAGKVFFRATNGVVGQELWVTDGTAAGTRMVKDISTIDSSNPASFGELGGIAYFSATDNEHAAELWRSDGTEAGTYLLKDLNPGPFGSTPSNFLPSGDGFLYFTADGGNEGTELWRTDGTAAGTSLVKDINPGATASTPTLLTRVGAAPLIVFRATHADMGAEVWRSDGTAAGTYALEINPGTTSAEPIALTAFNGYVYFGGSGLSTGATAGGVLIGNELFRTDGTLAGTTLVQNINTNGTNGSSNSNPSSLCAAGGYLYFSALTSTWGVELWRIGTSGSASLVADIYAGANFSSSPTFITALDATRIVFRAQTADGNEPWVSDGTGPGTMRLADINPGSVQSFMTQPVVANGKAWFSAQTGTEAELWETDGTPAGTVRHDLNPNGQSSSPTGLVAYGTKLVFAATGPSGTEPYVVDAEGAHLLADLNVQPSSTPGSFAVLGTKVLFAADDGEHGRELWISDGTPGGTGLLTDLAPATGASSNPTQLITVGDYVFFRADHPTAGGEVFRTDGTAEGTVLVTDICPGATTSNPTNFYAAGATLYFAADDCSNGVEPWTITADGTAALLRNIHTGALGGSSPANFVAMGGLVYFRATDPTNGAELWVSDGTTLGTTLVKDIRSGSGSSSPGGSAAASSAGSLVVCNGRLFFPAVDVATGNELWSSDGTAAGTTQVGDLVPDTGSSNPNSIREVNGVCVFAATTPEVGRELYRAVPSGGGYTIELLKDVREGPKNGNPSLGLVFGGTAIFTAADEIVGNELWITDGVTATLLVDARPGTGGSVANNLVAIGPSEMWYTGNDGINGTEPWRTDLTAAGTTMIQDINPFGPSYGGATVGANGVVYFAATDGVHGFELWRY